MLRARPPSDVDDLHDMLGHEVVLGRTLLADLGAGLAAAGAGAVGGGKLVEFLAHGEVVRLRLSPALLPLVRGNLDLLDDGRRVLFGVGLGLVEEAVLLVLLRAVLLRLAAEVAQLEGPDLFLGPRELRFQLCDD